MRDLKSKSVPQLKVVLNRAARLYGMGRLEKEQFDKINDKIQELIKLFEEVDEFAGPTNSPEQPAITDNTAT